MKKSKRIISLFLAVLMLFGCFGAITASAMTNEAAEAAAAEFNATVGDHSGVYANKSEKEWNKTMTNLNKALASIIKSKDVASTIYSDATLNALIPTLLTVIPENTMFIGSYMKVAKTVQFFEANGLYPEVTEYLKTLDKWANFDASKAVWGITDRESFAVAASSILAPTFGATFILLASLAPDVFNGLLIPVLESLSPDPFKDCTEFTAGSTAKDCRPMTEYLMNYICDIIDNVLANPIEYTCSVLPGFAKAFEEGMYYLKNTNNILTSAIDVSTLPDDFNGLVQMIIGGLAAQDINITVPEIDSDYLITMGTASVVNSGRGEIPKGKVASYDIAIAGNKTMVFASVAQYIEEVLQNKDNQTELGRVIAEKVGGYGDEYMAVVNASKDGSSFDVANALLNFADAVAEDLTANANPIVAFFAKVANFFTNVFQKIFGIFRK